MGVLLGMQQSYTNYCCFLSEWGSRDKNHRYVRIKHWPQRHTFTSGNTNISCEPLVNPQDVYLPPVNMNPLALELDIYSLAHHLCKM